MRRKSLISGLAVGAVVGFAVPLCYRALSERLAKYRRKVARRKAASFEVQAVIRATAEEYFPSLTDYQTAINEGEFYEGRYIAISFNSNDSGDKVADSNFPNELRRRIGESLDFCVISIW